MVKAVLFDLDGTLVDTSGGIINSINETLCEFNLPELTDDLKRSFIGPPIIKSLKSTYNLSDEKATVVSNYFRKIYKDKYLMDAVLYEGILTVLKKIKSKNIKIAIATYKREDYAKLLIKNIGLHDYCDFIKGGDYNNLLTKTDILGTCLKEININPDEAIFIGDTYSDYDASNECGTNFIAINYGFGKFNVSNLESVNFVAYEPLDLLKYFEKILI